MVLTFWDSTNRLNFSIYIFIFNGLYGTLKQMNMIRHCVCCYPQSAPKNILLHQDKVLANKVPICVVPLRQRLQNTPVNLIRSQAV